MKQLVKTLNRREICFQYSFSTFSGTVMKKITIGIFNGLQIRQFMKDLHFAGLSTVQELAAWTAFVLVVKNFLGNYNAGQATMQGL